MRLKEINNGDIDFILDNDIFLDEDQLDLFDLSLISEQTIKYCDKEQEKYVNQSEKILRRIK